MIREIATYTAITVIIMIFGALFAMGLVSS